MRYNNQNIVGEKPVINDMGTQQKKPHGRNVRLNTSFIEKNKFPDELPVEGPSFPITTDKVRKTFCKKFLTKLSVYLESYLKWCRH